MNLSSFDLNLLRVLDALLHDPSTVRVGQRIGLSQSAVSAALGRLRAALDDPLFVRRGQRLEPTDFARGLALPLRAALDDLETLLAGLPGFDPATADACFCLSGSDFFAEVLMPRLGGLVAQRAPGIRLQLVDLVADNHIAALDNQEIDIALIPQPDLPSWADWRALFSASFVMIARTGHARLAGAGVGPGETVPIDLFCDLGHILCSPEGKLRAMGDAALDRVGRRRRVVMTMPVFYGVCSAVAASDHVALVPTRFAQSLAAKLGLALYRPPMPMPQPVIGMAWHRRASRNPAHAWLRDRIAEVMAPGPAPS